ncbi:MAG: TPM domain-containing protein [Chitinophagales bacterium]
MYLLICCLFFASNLLAQIPPAMSPPRLVNDFADIIPAGKEQVLEQKLRKYNDSTSTQIVVAALTSLNGDEPYNVAQEIIEQWGVGQKGKDNGVVILVAPNERKMFISTGYGVEHILTDAMCKQIIEDYMLPHFKKGDYHAGIDNAINIIFGLMVGEYEAEDIMSSENSDAYIMLFIFLFLLFFWVILPAYINRKNGYTYSGKGRENDRQSSNGFPPIIFWGGGSGHSGHDSWGDFSSGDGDFGGFGGGSGGGGGAGGEW